MSLNYDKHTEHNICEFYRTGYTMNELSAMYRCSVTAISRLLKKNGIECDNKTNGFRDFRDIYHEIGDRYLRGITIDALAGLYETTSHTIRRILAHLDITLRKYTIMDKCDPIETCAKCGGEKPIAYTEKHSAVCKECYQEYKMYLQKKYF